MIRKSKKLIAYCGLYCGDCPNYQGKIADHARALIKELRQPTLQRFTKLMATSSNDNVFTHFKQGRDFLDGLTKFQCLKVCREGGRSLKCEIRKCCLNNKFDGCWQCEQYESCDKFEFLKQVHLDANLKNLRKLSKKGAREFLAGKKYW